ncbi:SUSD1 protein, partial [Psilopogon haemacephalus]|nr:SUSD1 protein [Psilopogon haemacephalus]
DVCATCHIHATCHQIDGKSVCICNYGFVGNGRTHCQDKDECQIGASKICGNHTMCHNTHGSFYCVCLDGYRASNNNKTFIPNDGTNCTDIDECEESGLCGRNARCVNTEGSYKCYCNDGYKLENGEHSFLPDQNTVSCKEIGCGSPPEMKHGYIVGNYSLVPGSVVHYDCEEGFYSNEGKLSYCTTNETWEPATLSCKGVDCGVPPPVLNAHPVSVNGTTYRSEVTYNCAHGYFIASGHQTAVCNATGQWDGADLVCKEEEFFSNLSIFNETCVKWQTGRRGVQKTYTFHVLGQRWDEKTFSEDATFNITTSEDNPKVCLDLHSGSNYVVNITTISSTNTTVSVAVAVEAKGRLCFPQSASYFSARHFSFCSWWPLNLQANKAVALSAFRKVCQTCFSSICLVGFGWCSGISGYTQELQLMVQSLLVSIPFVPCFIVFTVKDAFSNVLIFNDTCLKWQRNVRDTEVEDRYVFHVQGQRWYQKEFFDEIIFNLTTNKQAPEVCFDLHPGTNYSINISMVALNFSLLVSMTTEIT